MQVAFKQATDFSMESLARLLTRAFANYVGGVIGFSAEGFADFIWHESLSLSFSTIAICNDTPCGLAMISRRGWTSRLGAMGIVPEARGRGLGTALLEHVLRQAKARGDKQMLLECIEQNAPALRLYRRAGFHELCRLVGYHGVALVEKPASALAESDIPEIAGQIIRHGADNLPWQADGFSVHRLGPPARGFRLGPAAAIISDPEPPTVALHAIIVKTPYRRRGHGRRLLRALAAKYPGKTWVIRALCPEAIGQTFFKKCGFQRSGLSQFLMQLELSR